MYVSSEFIHEAALAYHRDVNAFWALHVLSQMAFIWRFDQTKHFHAQDGDRFNHIMSQLFTNLIKSLRQTFSHENGSHDHDHIIYIYIVHLLFPYHLISFYGLVQHHNSEAQHSHRFFQRVKSQIWCLGPTMEPKSSEQCGCRRELMMSDE